MLAHTPCMYIAITYIDNTLIKDIYYMYVGLFGVLTTTSQCNTFTS